MEVFVDNVSQPERPLCVAVSGPLPEEFRISPGCRKKTRFLKPSRSFAYLERLRAYLYVELFVCKDHQPEETLWIAGTVLLPEGS